MPAIKFIAPTLLFCLSVIAGITLLDRLSPSGPCNPGLGMVAFFFLLPVWFVVLLNNVRLAVAKSKRYLVKAAVHLVCLCLFLFVM